MGVLLEGKEGPLDLRAQASMPWRTLNGDKDRDDDSGGGPRAHPRTRLGFGYMASAALCC